MVTPTGEPGRITPQERARALIESVVGVAPPEWLAPFSAALSAFRAEMVGAYRAWLRVTFVRLGLSPGVCDGCKGQCFYFTSAEIPHMRVVVDEDGRIHREGPVQGRLSPCPRRRG